MRYVPSFVKYFVPDGWTFGCDKDIGVADISNRKDCEKKYKDYTKNGIPPQVIEKENLPFSGFRLSTMIKYHKFPSVFDIVDQNGYTLQISDSVLFDCAMNATIINGINSAELIWVNNSGIELTRVGGETHKYLLSEDAKLNAGSLKQQVGCVYKTKSHSRFIFLGKMDGVRVVSYDNPNYRYSYGYGYGRNASTNTEPRYLYKYTPESGFLYYSGDELPNLDNTYYCDSFVFCKTRKPMYEFVKDLKLGTDWLTKLQDKALAKLKPLSGLVPSEYDTQKLSRLLNMGSSTKVHPEVDKIFGPGGAKFS